MKTSDRNDTLVAVGIPSLITVLVVMLLGCFCVLSLIAARNDGKLSQKAADAISRFYEADLEATQRLAELKELISSGEEPAQHGFELQTIDGQEYICYNVPVDEYNSLYVEIFFEHENNTLTVTKWQTANNAEEND